MLLNVSLDHRVEPEVSLPGDRGRRSDGGVGVSQIRDMPVDVFPEFAPPLVEIQTEGIGMYTAEVEELSPFRWRSCSGARRGSTSYGPGR